MSDMKDHPEHRFIRIGPVGSKLWEVTGPRSRGWSGFKARRACKKNGGHWWHPEGMIDWFCCQCGAQRDGMPQDGT